MLLKKLPFLLREACASQKTMAAATESFSRGTKNSRKRSANAYILLVSECLHM